MRSSDQFEIFLACAPGLEHALCDEAASKGFKRATATAGGATIWGGWPEVWRANLWLRGANTVIVRIATFRAEHLNDLERQAGRVGWASVLRPDSPVRVEASCRKSRIYHSAAAAERVARGIQNSFAAGIADDARVTVHVRLDHDQCSIGLDTSGDLLHKRGFKAEVGKAPMRETVAAMLLRLSGYDGREPVVDPMCGSGTFVIEAAEIAAGLNPGRGRSFAFEHLATFDAAAWQKMRKMSARPKSDAHAYGSDRDTGAIRMSVANALRAGVEARTTFARHTISEIRPPAGPPGLVIVNPPYGDRIGDKERLKALHGALGRTLLDRFKGWRVALVTSEKTLAYATSLPFLPPSAPIANGGLRITLFQTGPLP